ncbi:hypothetical protein HDU91_006865 [Kappamyces sp. JEL0680]|nr:hypothetical protein HDU91_006865 [Kappamyces sp. JEL0680]
MYVKSFDLTQLGGTAVFKDAKPTIDQLCDPLMKAAGETVTVNGAVIDVNKDAVYYPCGLIANSMFSDVIGNLTCVSETCQAMGASTTNYIWDTTSVAWTSDASRYGPQTGESGYLTKYPKDADLTTNVVPPPFWRTAFPQWANGYNHTNFPDLSNWPAFHVWMRTAGLPTFRKLWGSNPQNYLAAGDYKINITQSRIGPLTVDFDTGKYGGTKSVVISTTSLLGGKNSFLGGAYILTGLLCVCLAIAFLIRNMVNPRYVAGSRRLGNWATTSCCRGTIMDQRETRTRFDGCSHR